MKYFVLNFDSNFIESRSQWSNWQQFSIGSCNNLALSRRQAITWTIADPVHWRIYVVPGEDELSCLNVTIWSTIWYGIINSQDDLKGTCSNYKCRDIYRLGCDQGQTANIYEIELWMNKCEDFLVFCNAHSQFYQLLTYYNYWVLTNALIKFSMIWFEWFLLAYFACSRNCNWLASCVLDIVHQAYFPHLNMLCQV